MRSRRGEEERSVPAERHRVLPPPVFAQAKDAKAAAAAAAAAVAGSVLQSVSSVPNMEALVLNSPRSGAPSGSSAMLVDDDDKDDGVPLALLAAVVPYRSRLNVMRTDMPYATLEGPDPPLLRPNVFHVSGMPGGGRVDEIQRLFLAAELGKPKVTYVGAPGSGAGALVEVDVAAAPEVLYKLMGVPKPVLSGGAWPGSYSDDNAAVVANGNGAGLNGGKLRVVTWEQYAREKAAAATAAADQGRPNKRVRSEGAGPATDAAAVAAGMRLSEGVAPVSRQAGGRGCAIM